LAASPPEKQLFRSSLEAVDEALPRRVNVQLLTAIAVSSQAVFHPFSGLENFCAVA
jgi:hypothetical protein